ncbi:trimeric intracellular cation channel family protein [Alkalilimnicola sp. S0819]|uniref:trimeric intracellular cation channel family protein n=1 Tax=Alkalilimnicola sp. S0819 TaxID=2613922 RepID=UPI001262AC22|nr:trimeric intracellular cation channel family protein [Alkalilimnicola sp. S0819]KAB7619685.1 trimeric intracellular cation channel family protein [Alkalilimnicola sp. S0819]MPQ17542.1 trimeric intracellular cation channel family protein [Alkalilimnicola sp. S0819]
MFYLLDLFGVMVFAVTGALAAGRKNMDIFGVLVLAVVTALGGGTLRDMALGATPVFWVNDPAYLIAATVAAVLTVLGARWAARPRRLLPYADAVGLATFTVLGTGKALALGVAPEIAVIMGVMSGVVGGMVRDVLCGEVPLVLRKELYATAGFAGALVVVLIGRVLEDPNLASWLGALTVLVLRVAAIRWHLSLPVFTHQEPH